MELKKVKLVWFSPTGTTRTILESIAEGIGVDDVERIDLTLPESAARDFPTFFDELVVIGAPVYGGRLPVDAVKRFRRLKADGALAIPVVLYGNREFEDALLELHHLAVALGFIPVAAGAFIGEHSFATGDLPIANGRPDHRDVQKAVELGAGVREKIGAMHSSGDPTALTLPGRFPYEAAGARPLPVSPVTLEAACTLCGTCAGVCPTAAIAVNGGVRTRTERCIRCCACIKSCPAGARVMADKVWRGIAEWLSENCRVRKEPRVFGIDG